jgi:nicotinamidase-related amidase
VNSLPPGAALLVVDVQRGLFEKATPIYRADDLVANICALMERARAAGAPVVVIQHANQGFLSEGSPGWQLHPSLQPAAGDLRIRKRQGNAFQNTPLHEELAARGVDTVVVTGLVTHGCVKATCLGAAELGYRIILVSDGHSSFHVDAAHLIDEWNAKLAEEGIVELCAAQEVAFSAPGVPA